MDNVIQFPTTDLEMSDELKDALRNLTLTPEQVEKELVFQLMNIGALLKLKGIILGPDTTLTPDEFHELNQGMIDLIIEGQYFEE